MDWNAILNTAKATLATLNGSAALQAAELLGTFEQALPAIKAGIASAEPFIVNGFKLLAGGDEGTPQEQWAIQLSLMQAQVQAVDAQVAADAAAQP